MLSSTQPWLLLWAPKSLPSATTSLARVISASLLRDHQNTPAATTPTTKSTISNATASRIFNQVGMGIPPVEYDKLLVCRRNDEPKLVLLELRYFKYLSNHASTVLYHN